MSSKSSDPDPRRPRRPSSAAGPPRKATPGRTDEENGADDVEGPSTFRPVSAKKPPSSELSRKKKRPPGESDLLGGEPYELPEERPRQTGKKPKFDPKVDRGGSLGERVRFGRVSAGLLSQYCRQFAVYLNAGVALTRVFDSLSKRFKGTAMGPVNERLALAIRRGDTLSEAVAKEPQAFDPMFLSMIRAAEARGGLPESLARLADHYEARQNLMRQTRSALIYPTAVIFVCLAVGGLLTIFVLPKLVDILREFAGNATLPLPTRMLMGLSDFIQAVGWWLLPALLVATPFVLVRMYRTAKGKDMLDRLILRIPVMGKLMKLIDTARFSRAFADLLRAGVDLGTSIDLTADVLQTTPYQEAVRGMRKKVVRGADLSTAIADTGRFDHEVLAYVQSGEETGTLPESLLRLADEYEDRVSHMVKNLGSLIQPLILIVLGAFVGFIVISFVLAYVSLISKLTTGF
jgi:type II secretory pathway component PulF